MAERKKLTPKTLPRSAPEDNPDWQRGQEWVQTNMAAQALNTYRQFKEKTAQDAYDYVISQGGTPEQAAMARTEVARGFARSELATTAMTPIGPARTAAAIAAPAREAGQLALTGPRPMLALPPPTVPRVSPTTGSAADIARSRAPQSLDEMRAALGLPPSETVRTIEAMPTTTRPSAGSPADIARNRPVQSLEEQRAALGLPTAEQAQINEAIRIARERAAIEAMPVNVSPTVGSAAQRGMEVNREFANMTNAQRRASVGLPPQTQAELEALDLARMATEGPIPEKVYRMPDAVSGYRRAVNDRYEPMPRRPVQAEVVTMPESLAGTTAESRALATRPGLPTTAGGSQELVSYGPFNSTINAPGGGSRLPPGVAGVAGGLGAGGLYLATRDRGAAPAPASAPTPAPASAPQQWPVQGSPMPSDLSITGEAGAFNAPRSLPTDLSITGEAGAFNAPRPAAQREASRPLPPQRPQPAASQQGTGVNNLLRSIFSGEDYQSTGQRTVENGKINWGNPDLAADFFRADRARMAMEESKKAEEGRASGGRATGKPDAVHKALEIIHHLISSR